MKAVVSASRRIDMPATCPDRLVSILEARFPPERTHTLVVWTKNPECVISDPRLRACLSSYPSVFVHATITGMGGSFLEPRVPPVSESLRALEDLVDAVSGPDHVAVRFDPIVHLRLPDGTSYSNVHHFDRVAERAARLGIRRMIVSWMQLYRKVEKRLALAGVEAETMGAADWVGEAGRLRRAAARHGVDLRGCCVPGWPPEACGSCIDGDLFQRIHPDGAPCSRARARGQRELCRCTHSIDIGWYAPCVHGCLYCYANPRFYAPVLSGENRPR